jgi:hypothetical protein
LEDGKAPKKKKGAGAYDYLTGLVEGIADGISSLRGDQRQDRDLVNKALERVHERLDCMLKKKYVTLDECEARCRAKEVTDIEKARLLAESKRFVNPWRAYLIFPIIAAIFTTAVVKICEHLPVILKALGW